eukprot:scaffold2201_cov240-Pinguiococcus_pyrenoidosus.AAC.8
MSMPRQTRPPRISRIFSMASTRDSLPTGTRTYARRSCFKRANGISARMSGSPAKVVVSSLPYDSAKSDGRFPGTITLRVGLDLSESSANLSTEVSEWLDEYGFVLSLSRRRCSMLSSYRSPLSTVSRVSCMISMSSCVQNSGPATTKGLVQGVVIHQHHGASSEGRPPHELPARRLHADLPVGLGEVERGTKGDLRRDEQAPLAVGGDVKWPHATARLQPVVHSDAELTAGRELDVLGEVCRHGLGAFWRRQLQASGRTASDVLVALATRAGILARHLPLALLESPL